VAGPATNAATLATVFKVLGKKTALVYLATVALGSLAAGLALDTTIRVLGGLGLPEHHMTHEMTVAWWQHISAVALVAMIALSLWGGRVRKAAPAASEAPAPSGGDRAGEGAVVLKIDGMTCEHCSSSVARGLRNAPGVTSAEVDLAAGQATVRGENLDLAGLRQVVQDLGYEVVR
ncbi:MAG TPA: cation transporter, partial [Candidatus Hydrogenedentes bacterium]|nr:cation transporter [Candidatus Hydrogenedentota bacterium]